MLISLIVGILCTNALTELVRHDGRLTDFRIKMETLDGGPVQRFLKGVIGCGWCLSHWMAIITAFILIGPYAFYPHVFVHKLLYLVAFALAITRGANLLNDYWRPFSRTPKAPERDSNGTI
jgi:hypothetical protein